MKIEEIKIDHLTPYKLNAKKHPQEQIDGIAESIRRFGFTQPIVIDSKNVIIIGHGRHEAAKKVGLKTVPCVKIEGLSDKEIRALRLIDNRIAETEWDQELLKIEFEDLDFNFEDFNIDFDADVSTESTEGLTDPDEVPETPKEPKTKLGEIYKLGDHRLMCGDSTNSSDVQKLMGGGMADLLLTDPPYNVAYEGKTEDALTIKNDSMSDGDFRKFLQDVYRAANAVMRPGAAFYVWHADSEGYNFRGAAKDVGWTVRQCLIWAKNSLVLGRQDYHWRHEPCLYGWKDGAAHYWGSDRSQTTLLEFNRPTRNGEHPTMKPVDMFRYQIENSSRPRDAVLDLFGGSGTTMIACEQAGRHAYLMELDPKYCDVIIKRWEDFTGKKAELLS